MLAGVAIVGECPIVGVFAVGVDLGRRVWVDQGEPGLTIVGEVPERKR